VSSSESLKEGYWGLSSLSRLKVAAVIGAVIALSHRTAGCGISCVLIVQVVGIDVVDSGGNG